MPKVAPAIKPAPGERLQRFVGDRIRFTMTDVEGQRAPEGWQARLRTNLGRASLLNSEIIQAHTKKIPPAGASWRDLPMESQGGGWSLELPLTEPGYFKAKSYFIDPQGWQHWPGGADVGISVHPSEYRTNNTIYCAFTRMFGGTRTLKSTANEKLDQQLKQLDAQGYSVIPPSGTFRDLILQLPHILDKLGCRILHLLPVSPTPTVYARFGRFGSPYASLDLTAIDPALVVFDRRTTAVDQFRELTYATHLKGGRVFLDIVINHTGWGSTLQDKHPEWFLRGPDGAFVSPGAWGVTWEDLVEMEHRHVELWDYLSEVFLTWCRRGVDGFRCDAGYKVPLAAWQYITARVRQEFPNTIFLLEGLGGAWDITEQLLAEGGMQWAYSELFQNYSGLQVGAYLDHSLKQSRQSGLLVHYSETHDNERLAARGCAWSLLRNRLCALTSMSGGYGFTCGVEWLAPESVNVHSSRGLAWDNQENIVSELAGLNQLLAEHPCFFDGAKLTRLSAVDAPVYVLRRDSEEGVDSVLVVVNNDTELSQTIALTTEQLGDLGELKCELTGQSLPKIKRSAAGLEFAVGPGAGYCFSTRATPRGLSGERYRRARAQAAWALIAMGQTLSVANIPAIGWQDLARLVDENPADLLAAISTEDGSQALSNLKRLLNPPAKGGKERYAPVVIWDLLDTRRIVPVPPGHWLLVEDATPFRATLTTADKKSRHAQSIEVKSGHVAFFAPDQTAGDATLSLERYAADSRTVRSSIRYLAPDPRLDMRWAASSSAPAQADIPVSPEAEAAAKTAKILEQPLVLLTNGIGGMARMGVDFGAIKSKYDCLLGANLNPRVPVDRHIFVKRARLWINANGFITPLDLRNLSSFRPGPPAVWHFVANAGDGRTVELEVSASMLPERNTTVLHFTRIAMVDAATKAPASQSEVRLTVRVDIEDRNFHSETKRNGGAEHHFASNSRILEHQIGFAFTPAADRFLRVFSDGGFYHHQAEWCENIPHPIEQSRGQTGSGDAYSPGWFDLPLQKGKSISLVFCADADDPSAKEIQNSKAHGKSKSDDKSIAAPDAKDEFGAQILQAAREFVVRRDSGSTVIAGYPWFLDWGRDSLICARGLLAGGLVTEVKQLLTVFGRFVKDGTLPNTIHGDDATNRDTTDAPLWYGIVCEEMAAREGKKFYDTHVDDRGKTISDVLVDIASHYASGTPNGIRMDAASALIWSPAHFTWMDTNFPAGTPREGYPVEIQVLWIRLLRQLERLKPAEKRWAQLAGQAQASLQKYFWLEEQGYLADLLIAKPGVAASSAQVDNALRSNCLLAVSLELLKGQAAQRCVAAAARYLVVPGALRSLAPLPVSPPLAVYGNQGQLLNNPPEPYWGRYEGDEDTRRKPAYHNGTAWTWTFPIFCEALARAWENSEEAVAAARAYLGSVDRLLAENCLGQLPEIVDGDAPHTQRGCDAQAWGATEVLRVWNFLKHPK